MAMRMAPTENFFVYRTPMMSAHISSGINYFDRLSDEILLDIFKWLPKKTLLRIASVCRRFNCCARDETLWTRLDLGLRTLRPHALEHVVRRGVPVLRLAQADVRQPNYTNYPSNLFFILTDTRTSLFMRTIFYRLPVAIAILGP